MIQKSRREFPDIFWTFKCVDYGHVRKKMVNADNATILNVTNGLVVSDMISEFVRWSASGKIIGPGQKSESRQNLKRGKFVENA